MIIITNRNCLHEEGDPCQRFGSEFNTLGSDEIRVAIADYQGSKGWSLDILDDTCLLNGKPVPASEYAFRYLQQRMKQHQRNCLFYVHGFNNDFADVLTTAHELESLYDVEVVAFSWPANGRQAFAGRAGGVASYLSDKREANQSVVALDRVLEKLCWYLGCYNSDDDICDMRLSILFHSMGNYLFKCLFKSGVFQGETGVFDNVILCQADVNNLDHELWVDRIAFRRRLYITINENDYALGASRMKFGERQLARLGHFSTNLVAGNACYINLTEADQVNMSHSPFDHATTCQNPKLQQLFRSLFNGEAVEKRLTFDSHCRAYEL
ncbi:alpha/beta hydrolase [Kistimonas asteriae]|uniref:alpha/beta hydrolase n=1 Tax=Kistimonas asteriae TaxID=517724 RepID=UPI001BAA5DFF|nr:alpha/beta hydrolase [Kistimonas asteriae]